MACVSGSLPLVQPLLDYAADVNLAGDSSTTPLALAADGGHIAVVTCLLNAAAAVDVPDCAGRTALMSASAHAHEDVVDVLLEAGADPLAKSIDGCTAMLYAIEYLTMAREVTPEQQASGTNVVALLLAAQADLAAAALHDKGEKGSTEVANVVKISGVSALYIADLGRTED
jgi:ankyrin repeat protein